MFERVTIIGAGAAGLAAAWAAAQRGAQIRLLDGGVGASCLTGGAVDDRPWEQMARSSTVLQMAAVAGTLPHSVRVFSDDLELQGSRTALLSFFALLEQPDEGFPIVTP